MRVLILGLSKRDCEQFAKQQGINEWDWVSPASPHRVRGSHFPTIYATDALHGERVQFERLVAETKPCRRP